MKVGTICKLKVACLGNKAGTLGVVFYDYANGVQAIFENGHYDGFSRINTLGTGDAEIEVNYFLEEVGFEESYGDYQFTNVLHLEAEYRKGLFDIAWSESWKRKAAFRVEVTEPEYENCEVYADGNKPPWLMFKRKKLDGCVTVCMLSAAKDYVDFSHFEYAHVGKSFAPRLLQGDKAVCPLYVVFRKKGDKG